MFKKKERQQAPDQPAPSAHKHDESPTYTNSTSEQGETTDAPKKNDVKPIQDDTTYPSGLKLALLMTSIFIGMFLVSLVSCHSAYAAHRSKLAFQKLGSQLMLAGSTDHFDRHPSYYR
jgi:hypothetical protein